MRQDLRFFARVYLELLEASETLKEGLESVRFNADHGFTQQFQVLLAPLLPTDDDDTVKAKLKLTADYLDCWLNRRLWNFKSIDYSTLQYATFLLTKELRNLSLEVLRDKLITRLTSDQTEFPLDDQPYLNNWNAKSLHRQLARFTHWLEEQSGQPGRYLEYIVRSGKKRLRNRAHCGLTTSSATLMSSPMRRSFRRTATVWVGLYYCRRRSMQA